MVCIVVDVAQSVNGGPCLWSCSMLSADISVFVTIVCHLFHCEQMSVFGYLCSYCTFITHGFFCRHAILHLAVSKSFQDVFLLGYNTVSSAMSVTVDAVSYPIRLAFIISAVRTSGLTFSVL